MTLPTILGSIAAGILCLIIYILILGIGIIYAIKSFKKENIFNFKLTAIFAAWITYLAHLS